MNLRPPEGGRQDEVAVLEMDGDLDLFRSAEVARAIRTAEARGPAVLVLDLRRVSFIDSTILRVILAAHIRALNQARRVAVAVGSETVRRVFRITLLEWRLEIVDDPANVEAVPAGRREHDDTRNHG